jgi:hypothetical protein
VSELVDQGVPVPSGLLVKGGFPPRSSSARRREAATPYEALAKAASDPDLVKGYGELAEQKRHETRGAT